MKTSDRTPDKDELFSVIDRAIQFSSGNGELDVRITAYWQGITNWSRNRIGVSSNITDYGVYVQRKIDGGYGRVVMNQIDDESLKNAVKYAEWKATTERRDQSPSDFPLEISESQDGQAYIWGNATANYDFLDSGKIVQLTCQRAEELDLMAAGSIDCTSTSVAYSIYDETSQKEYRSFARLTRGNCSVTARNPKGLGSGWSGITDIDFDRVDEEAIANKAFDKCIASMNPVRVEPGRYTTILEPQAVADLVGLLLFSSLPVMDRIGAEKGGGHPFYLGYDAAAQLGRSKLGLKVFDDRINVWHDPMDPQLGAIGFVPENIGLKKISYVENGVLVSLPYEKRYAANRLESSDSNSHRLSFRMSGGDSTVEEMIESTERGLLVTRFSGGSVGDASSLVASGLTRDGLWLIENGKIKHSVRNFRTLESPLFILNNIQQIGVPEKVYVNIPQVPSMFTLAVAYSTKNFAPQYVVPALKVNDFSFSATIDAI